MKQFFKDNAVLSGAGLCGLVVFALLFGRAYMTSVRPQPLSIDQITAGAVDFARLEGWAASTRWARTLPIEGDDAAVVREAAAARGERPPDRASLPDPMWETSVVTNSSSFFGALRNFKPPDPILDIAATPSGEVVQYVEVTTQIASSPITGDQRNREIPLTELNLDRIFAIPSETRRELTDDEWQTAVATARDFFGRHAIDVAGDPAAAGSQGASDQLVAVLKWERPGPAGTVEITRVAVANGRVAAYDRDLRMPGRESPSARTSVWVTLATAIPVILLVLSGAVVAVAIIIRRRQGELELRSATVLFFAYLVLSIITNIGMLAFLLSLMASASGYVLSWAYLIQFALGMPIGIALLCLLLAGCWAAGESQAYLVWPRQLIRPFSALIRGDLRSPLLTRPVVAGYLLAFAALGVTTIVGLVAPASSIPSVAPLSGFYYWPASVMPAVQGLTMGVSSTIVAGIFFMTYARLRVRRMWLVVIVGSLVFTLIRNQITINELFPTDPQAGLVMYVAFAVYLALIFVKYGPVASLTTVYAYVVSVTAYPFILTGNHSHMRDGAWAIALGLVPAAIGAYAWFRPRDDESSVPTHIRRALDRLRIGEEFDVARRVQAQLLPDRPPIVEGLDVAGTCLPANEVGGDYFDYFPLAGNRFGVAVGDVSGKGVGAAIYMTLTKSYMVTQAPRALDPAGVLGRVNTHLRQNLARGTFVTMVYAVIDGSSRTLEYTRAGHNPPLRITREGDGDFLSAPGIALGCATGSVFRATTRVETVALSPGDLVLIYTDGVTEAMNLNHDEYGEERLISLAKRLAVSSASAAAVVDAILADVRVFVGRASQHDDITLVAIRVAG